MKLKMVLIAMVLTACGSDKAELKGTDEACSLAQYIDPSLSGYIAQFRESYEASGSDDLPIQWLDNIRFLELVPENRLVEESNRDGVEIPEGATLLAYNKTMRCVPGVLEYKILIPDPATMIRDPESTAMMQNAEIFAEVVLHEIGHVFYRHYNNNETLGTRKYGLMAAKTDDSPAEIKAGTAADRLHQLHADESYKAALPKKFIPKADPIASTESPEQGEVDDRTAG